MGRVQQLQPNTVYNYRCLLNLIYPYGGRVRASRLSARMVERAYRQLQSAGYSKTTLRTLHLVLRRSTNKPAGPSVRTSRESPMRYGRCGRGGSPALPRA